MLLTDLALVTQLRRLIGETDLTDDTLFEYLTQNDRNLNAAAAVVWLEKAGAAADLIDVKEGSSSRALGDIYEQATKMHAYFSSLANPTAASNAERRSRTRAIERP